MERVLRASAIVLLSAALLNATAGLCLCRSSSSPAPADRSGSHQCCHRSGPALSRTGTSCCHIDQMPHEATSTDVVVVTQPVFAWTPVLETGRRVNATWAGAVVLVPSPPGRILRV